MKDLSTLMLKYCKNPHEFVRVLDPSKNLSEDVVCPKLEEFVVEHCGKLDIRAVIGMAAARESRGAKLNSIWILSPFGLDYTQLDVLELKEYVSCVELMESMKVMRIRVWEGREIGQRVTLALL